MNQLIGYLSEGEQLKGSLTIPKTRGGGGGGTLETITKTYTPTTSQQTDTITPGVGYDGIAEVDVTVNAMPTGTEGTPTATKGAVSNHSVAVTPSVTNVAGYIAGGTKTGTAVTVSANELDSGTKSITANGNNQDVVGYAAVDVAVPNSYSAADEGKVVSSGALVAQTAHADVTPTTSDQTIDTTTNNSIKVKGDANLVAGNIKKDVVIFNTTGTYEGGGGGSDDFPKFLNNTLTELIDDNGDITSIVAYGCYGRSSLTNVRLSGCTSIGGYSFYNCSGLKSIVLPSHTGDFSSRIFQGCSSLEAIDTGGGRIAFSGATNVPWLNCANFDTLIVRKTDSIMPLSPASGTSSTFNGTPFANGTGGTLYVPSALINSYKTGTNWTTWFSANNTYGNQVLAIEGSYYQTHYADGSTIPT